MGHWLKHGTWVGAWDIGWDMGYWLGHGILVGTWGLMQLQNLSLFPSLKKHSFPNTAALTRQH